MMKKQYQNTINLWAETIARSRQGNLEENKAVMAYALHLLLFNLLVVIATLLTSFILGTFPTVAVTLIASGSLRIFTGGYHCSSPIVCLILSVGLMNFYGQAAVKLAGIMGLYHVLIFLIITMALSLYFILKNAPVETTNKPIKVERRNVLKKKGLRVWFFWVVALTLVSVHNINDYKDFILAIGLGIINQTFSISGILRNKS
ncbi:accessory gene regulator B [Desulforamulus profundi]|uniref:Accessory gene regulator B n=1 Tax=Desulforamulus profundi TaxID=1383067 RepID=A0A2C6MEL2_9FIRM|nr:accessory gene regulator B [Desulforamulus profundi]